MERFELAAGKLISQREAEIGEAHPLQEIGDGIYFQQIGDSDLYYKTSSPDFVSNENLDDISKIGYEIYSRDSNAEKRVKKVREVFKTLKRLEPAILGIYNARKKKVLNIVRTTIGYNAESLRNDTGNFYPVIVDEETITATMRVPTEGPPVNKDEVRDSLIALWESKGMDPERAQERILIETRPNVNKEMLRKLEESGKVEISPETRIKGLTVRIDSAESVILPIKKQ